MIILQQEKEADERRSREELLMMLVGHAERQRCANFPRSPTATTVTTINTNKWTLQWRFDFDVTTVIGGKPRPRSSASKCVRTRDSYSEASPTCRITAQSRRTFLQFANGNATTNANGIATSIANTGAATTAAATPAPSAGGTSRTPGWPGRRRLSRATLQVNKNGKAVNVYLKSYIQLYWFHSLFQRSTTLTATKRAWRGSSRRLCRATTPRMFYTWDNNMSEVKICRVAD